MSRTLARFREARRFVKIFWLPIIILTATVAVQMVWWESRLPIVVGGLLAFGSLFRKLWLRQWLGAKQQRRRRMRRQLRIVYPQ